MNFIWKIILIVIVVYLFSVGFYKLLVVILIIGILMGTEEELMSDFVGFYKPDKTKSSDFSVSESVSAVSETHAKNETSDWWEAESAYDDLLANPGFSNANHDEDADTKIMNRQKRHHNKTATDGRVNATKKLYEKYFVNEFAENEEREWWSSEANQGDESPWWN